MSIVILLYCWTVLVTLWQLSNLVNKEVTISDKYCMSKQLLLCAGLLPKGNANSQDYVRGRERRSFSAERIAWNRSELERAQKVTRSAARNKITREAPLHFTLLLLHSLCCLCRPGECEGEGERISFKYERESGKNEKPNKLLCGHANWWSFSWYDQHGCLINTIVISALFIIVAPSSASDKYWGERRQHFSFAILSRHPTLHSFATFLCFLPSCVHLSQVKS